MGAANLQAQEDNEENKPADLKIRGSDTMLQLNIEFIKRYTATRPGLDIQVSGQGSSLGFKGLVDGTALIAAYQG